ncbi:hypothetical protein F0L68_25125 [Solihabitans fulvus]|uniref:Uncharacterized protein n=1 Tax=Solihabitans fulvus TaxID=1892852 RepID=A0A5B2X334_9PSEU|nr:hypothetical protein [Solihabitans fulvus]KAA2257581.1 hypothetical protein F0L68_25125 [Solihabitans fulvus]
MTGSTGAAEAGPTDDGRSGRVELVGSWLLLVALLCENFGVVWDVQWHDDVGPDTFFTAPHMLIYTAPALAGLTSVFVVLHNTFRASRTSAGGGSVRVLGVFRAPVGFLVAGVGGAVELAYGLADLWWHTVYGFDVTLNSPPHVGLALGGMAICVGAILAFVALRRRRAGRWGLAASVSVSLCSMIFALFWAQPFPVSVTPICVFCLVMIAGVTRRPGWVTLAGLLFLATQAAGWVFAPWITRVYADSVGLPFRDNASLNPYLPSLYPMVLPVIAVLIEVGVLIGRRSGTSPKAALPVVGAVVGAGMYVGYTVQFGDAVSVPLAALVAALGAAAGWLGWRASFPLRRLGPAGPPPVSPGSSGATSSTAVVV